MRAKALAQRADLDALLQAFLALDPAAVPAPLEPPVPAPSRADPLAPLNLLVIAVATLAALVFQITLARSRRRRTLETEIARWREDSARDPDLPPLARVADGAAPLMKAAS